MTIKIGENPQDVSGINKFIAKSGDGMRGKIIALNKDNTQAIILAENSSFSGDVIWGHFYQVKEENPNDYPVVVKQVDSIDRDADWKIVV